MKRAASWPILLVVALLARPSSGQIAENWQRENLIAWCIVPFDARHRSPADRAVMLKDLGLRRCAYDWRAEHVEQFEQEILEYQKNGIELFAFWDEHEKAFQLFQKYGLRPQIWKTLTPNPVGETPAEKVDNAVESMMPLARRTKELGFPLGLYNHGGWGGEPENLIAVCQALRKRGFDQVGIVYNFHHGHGHINDFATCFQAMLPYLLCLNLNGMKDLADPESSAQKILPIGAGDRERNMIQTVMDSGYDGPIGILGHVAERDAADVLRENLEGLDWLLGRGERPAWLSDIPPATVPLVQIDGRTVLDARLGFLSIDASEDLNQLPLRIEVDARLFSRESFNILVAKNPKSSQNHFELYTYSKTGELSFYIPGYLPAEIRTGQDVCNGQWQRLGAEFDGRNVKLFVNGQCVHQQPVAAIDLAAAPADGPLTIGSLASRQFGCQGQISEVRIARLPLGERGNESLGIWRFDQATSVAEIHDLSGRDQKTEFVQTRLGGDYLSKWTPASRANSRFPYENETDADWVDHRYSQMDTGPIFNQSIDLPGRGIIPKAIAVRSAGESAHYLFNSQTLNIEAVWSGEFVALPPARFGILENPSVAGKVHWLGAHLSPWTTDETTNGSQPPQRFEATFLADDRVFFRYKIDATAVVESSWVRIWNNNAVIERCFWIDAHGTETLHLPLFDLPESAPVRTLGTAAAPVLSYQTEARDWLVRVAGPATTRLSNGQCELQIPPSPDPIQMTVWYGRVEGSHGQSIATRIAEQPIPPLTDWHAAIDRGKPRWGPAIVTHGNRGEDAGQPFVVDTIAMPYENAFHALMFASGFDWLSADSAALCTVHGDVWIVSGLDEDLDEIRWKRFATGLYQPLGLKVVDGRIIVLCRDRLTELIDQNGNGEADVYQNLNDDLVITGQNHGYAMSLECDPEGNFYFIKSGSSPPHGGTMLKVAADGSRLDVVATGYRHANGLGIRDDGLITSADNEGNWIPSTRIDVVRPGGFYGHLPTARRSVAPETYDAPLLWLPRSVDNSAGGQVWIPTGCWDSLANNMVHLSFGRCTANIVLPQQLGDTWQAAAYRLEIPAFISGAMRGRFNPADGHLYVCGLDGWQTAAVADGCFQRVRATGRPFCLPNGFAVRGNEIELRLTRPLRADSATDPSAWTLEQWNYRWTADYGSDHYSVLHPEQVGHDRLSVASVQVSDDGKVVTLAVDHLAPVMQLNIQARLAAADGTPVHIDLYATINKTN